MTEATIILPIRFNLTDAVVYRTLQFVGWVVGSFPPKVWNIAAKALAWIAWDVVRLRRRTMKKNLGVAFGPDYPNFSGIGRRSYYHLFLTGFEFLGAGKRDIAAHLECRGERIHIELSTADQAVTWW